MRGKFFLLLLVGLLFCSVGLQSAQAYSFTFDLDYVYSGTPPPGLDDPWARATFNDEISTSDNVILTLEAFNLTDSEFISEWYFNFNPDKNINNLRVDSSESDIAQVTNVDLKWKEDEYKAGGDGFYDIRFLFPPKTPGQTKDRFSAGEVVTIAFFMSGEDLNAGDFDFLSTGESGDVGPFGSAAHIQAIGGEDEDNSGWIADNPNPVPEPGTMLLVGMGLIGLAGFGRRRFKA